MLKIAMKYKSLHAYLDAVLHQIPHPTHADIKNAKREYWKLWYRHYRREKRKIRKEYTLGFDATTVRDIHNKRGKLSVSEFLYSCVFGALYEEKPLLQDQELLNEIHSALMQLLNVLEEAIEDEIVLPNIPEQLSQIEAQFEKLFIEKCS